MLFCLTISLKNKTRRIHINCVSKLLLKSDFYQNNLFKEYIILKLLKNPFICFYLLKSEILSNFSRCAASFTLACIFLPFEFVKSTSINLHSHLPHHQTTFDDCIFVASFCMLGFIFGTELQKPENMKNLLVILEMLKAEGL